MRRDFWINESVHKLIARHLEIIRENIKLRKELEKKQKLIRYYRKEKRRLIKELDQYRYWSITIHEMDDGTWCISYHYTPRNKKDRFTSKDL